MLLKMKKKTVSVASSEWIRLGIVRPQCLKAKISNSLNFDLWQVETQKIAQIYENPVLKRLAMKVISRKF